MRSFRTHFVAVLALFAGLALAALPAAGLAQEGERDGAWKRRARVDELRGALDAAKAEIQASEQRIRRLHAELDEARTALDGERVAEVLEVDGRIRKKEQDYENVSKRHAPDHPEMVQAAKELQALHERRRHAIEAAAQLADVRRQQALNEMTAARERLAEQERRHAQLEAELRGVAARDGPLPTEAEWEYATRAHTPLGLEERVAQVERAVGELRSVLERHAVDGARRNRALAEVDARRGKGDRERRARSEWPGEWVSPPERSPKRMPTFRLSDEEARRLEELMALQHRGLETERHSAQRLEVELRRTQEENEQLRAELLRLRDEVRSLREKVGERAPK